MPLHYGMSDLRSPQMEAVTGRRQHVPYERYLEGIASVYPEIKEREYQREIIEEQIELDAEAREQAKRDANISLGIQGAGLGLKAYPLMKEAGLFAKLGGGSAVDAIPQAAPVAGAEASTLGMGSSPMLTPLTTGGTTAVGAGAETASFGLSSLAAPAGVGMIAGRAGGGRFTREIGKLGGLVKDKKAQSFIGGGIKGAAAGAAYGTAFPVPGVGTGVGALVGFLSGGLSSLF